MNLFCLTGDDKASGNEMRMSSINKFTTTGLVLAKGTDEVASRYMS